MEQHHQHTVFSAQDLSVDFVMNGVHYTALDSLSITVKEGEIVGLIGESGCGKSLTALYAMGLQPPDAQKTSGDISLMGNTTHNFTEKQWNQYRGSKISMIFQDPMAVLNPLIKVGVQIAEAAVLHGKDKHTATTLAKSMMTQVGLPDVERIYHCYPHELSGGMCQRIMIAMALINNPSLLVADEPTTALDVTIQAQIIQLIQQINETNKTAVLFISHDLALVKQVCHRVYIMYAGFIIEEGYTKNILHTPMHPYTQGLLHSIPSFRKKGEELTAIPGSVPALEVRDYNGCPFAPRCSHCMPICKTKFPVKTSTEGGSVCCHLYAKHMEGGKV